MNQGWGADEGTAELKAETAGETDAKAEATPNPEWEAPTEGAEVAAPVEGEKAEGRPRRFQEEEEDNTLTLDEYIKQQKEIDVVPKLETRKANEGDDSIFKDAVAVTKKGEEDTSYFVGKVRSQCSLFCRNCSFPAAVQDRRLQAACQEGGEGLP